MKTAKARYRFDGGVHPQYHKDLTEDCPVRDIPLPALLAVSMSQHLGAPAKCVVKPGDRVERGRLIGEKAGFISANVHAPASGTVKAVEKRPGPTGALADAVIIETDAEATAKAGPAFPPLDWAKAPREELLARVEAAGICGMGGAGFPTAVKLAPPPGKRCEYLILNGAECEPYLTADSRVMTENADRVRRGAEIMRRILGGPAVRVAVEENKPGAIAALEKAFAGIDGDVEITILPCLYPQGSEKHQIRAVTGRIVPEGALPIETGCVVENVGTSAAVADAVERGEALVSRVTTVTGDGIANPCNVRAPCGTPYSALAEFAGGAKDVAKVVSGGPMMGFNVPDLGIATTKTTSGLLFLARKSVFAYTSQPCIGCGRCVRACPMGLSPSEISRSVEADDIAAAEALWVMDCIECGCCSFSCPAARDITQFCRRAKNSIRAARAAAAAKAKAK